jgi:hypothetical protein
MFQTEYEFTLPCGFLDEDGTLHKSGVMRRATAADEILPLKDPRVVKNEAYVIVILLSRVITRLGSVAAINPKVVESLFATDLEFLQGLYNRINRLDDHTGTCLHCGQPLPREDDAERGAFRVGEFSATPSFS